MTITPETARVYEFNARPTIRLLAKRDGISEEVAFLRLARALCPNDFDFETWEPVHGLEAARAYLDMPNGTP